MILVLGATGTVGSALVGQLAEGGVAVRAVAHSARGREALERQGVQAVDGDLDRPDTVEAALADCDRLFLLSPVGPRQVAREQAAIDAASKAGIGHVVALSVMGTDPQSPVEFVRAHAAIDQHLLGSGLSSTILRPAGFMQSHLMPVHTAGQGVWYGMTGDGASAFIDAEDIAAAAAAELTAQSAVGGVHELTGPAAITMPEAAAELSEVLGRPIRFVDLPADQFRAGMVDAGVPGQVADALVIYYSMIRAGHAATVTNSVEQLAGRPARAYREFAQANRAAFGSL